MESQFKENDSLELQEMGKTTKRKKKSSKPVFKEYNQHQMTFLPPSLEDFVGEKHIARILNQTIDQLDLGPLFKTYRGGGTSSFNPRMMLKVLVYGYIDKEYSSRRIKRKLRENVVYMWLSGGNKPDFRTINNFRLRLGKALEEIFTSLLLFLGKHGYFDLEKIFVDGSKFRADAKKSSYVWKKNTERYEAALRERVKQIFAEIERINQEEDKKYGDKDLPEEGEESQITSEEIKEKANQISESLKGSNLCKKQQRTVKSRINRLKKEAEKLAGYEEQKKLLEQRKSYSKTDTGATFFVMKNNELLPCYTTQIGTQNQYILVYGVFQEAADNTTFIRMMEKYYQTFSQYPGLASTDSIYGTEENYEFVNGKKIGNYLKYNTFHYESTKAYKENKFHKDHFPYNKKKDTYVCPNGQELEFKEEREVKTTTGYKQKLRIYECQDCTGCPYSKKCKKGEGNRTIQINLKLEEYKKQAKKNLCSEEGIKYRGERNIEPEPVFGFIKYNRGYNRFRLRGIEKVNLDFGLLIRVY